jgi:hypothetical protein
MQDEVLKHTEKIFDSVKNKEHSFWEKVREVIVEILIIVFAVSLSIGLHNWSDHRAEQKATDEFLAGLRIDLSKDIGTLENNIKTYREEIAYFQFLLDANKTKAVDTLPEAVIGNHFYFQGRTTHSNIARYEGFKSSGKLGTIEDDSLKQAILAYYQESIPGINDVEELENGLQGKLMDAEFNKDPKMSIREFAKSFRTIAYLDVCVQNLDDKSDGLILQYVAAVARAKGIIRKIDDYLKGK